MRDIDNYVEKYIVNDWENEFQVNYRRKQIIASMCKAGDFRRILEVGCGLEPLAKYIETYTEYTIVEPAVEFIDNARSKLTGKNVTYIQGELEKVSFKLKPEYDFIIVSSLLHEVENPLQLLKCVLELCNDDTVVHINVPNANSFHRLLALESGLIRDNKEFSVTNKIYQHHSVFDMDSLKQIIEEASNLCHKDISIRDKGSYFVKPFTHKQMEMAVNEGILNKQIIDGLNSMVKYMPDLGSEIYIDFSVTDKY